MGFSPEVHCLQDSAHGLMRIHRLSSLQAAGYLLTWPAHPAHGAAHSLRVGTHSLRVGNQSLQDHLCQAAGGPHLLQDHVCWSDVGTHFLSPILCLLQVGDCC